MQTTEEFYTNLENQIGGTGEAFIHHIKNGDSSDVKNMLEHPDLQGHLANPNHIVDVNDRANKDYVGKSALIIAIEKNNLDIVDLLLQNGADPNLIPKKIGKSAVIIALELGNRYIIESILQYISSKATKTGKAGRTSKSQTKIDLIRFLSYMSSEINNGNILKKPLHDYLVELIRKYN
jgi:ankyrin repeat protein